jgi:predicted nucleic acid-binding protein
VKAPVFLDTGYVLAVLNTRDKYHESASTAASKTAPPFISTEAVLIEIGNALAKIQWRAIGIAALDNLRSAQDIEIVPVDTALVEQAISLYSSRSDKEWGLTDCISFVVMQERGLTQVLTTDRHFEQAGFQNVLVSI